MCTITEVQRAIANGNVAGVAFNGTEYWMQLDYFRGFNTTNTVNNNCHNFLYPTANVGKGTAIKFFNSGPGGRTGVNYDISTAESCGAAKSFVCCQ